MANANRDTNESCSLAVEPRFDGNEVPRVGAMQQAFGKPIGVGCVFAPLNPKLRGLSDAAYAELLEDL